MADTVRDPLKRAFNRTEREGFRLSFSRTTALVGIVLVLMGCGLDYNTYPGELQPFFFARVFASVLIFVVYLILPTPWGRQRLSYLTLLWLCFPQVMIAWMISVTQGAESIYATGLHLAVFAAGSVLPFNTRQTIGFGVITYALYFLACLAHDPGSITGSTFFVNSQFLIFTSTLGVFCTYFNENSRFELFKLKEEVADKNIQLETINANLVDIKGQLLQQEKMAAIGTLSAGLLHEINNPVNFCLMAIAVAQEDPVAKDSPMLLECLVDAKEGMQRVQHIVSDLKTFAYRSPEKGEADAPFLAEKAIDSAIRLTSHELRGVSVERKLPPDTLVRGDEAAIIGVLINLLSNAALAMQKVQRENPRIEIAAEWIDNRLHVVVTDNGPGISEKNLTRVFEPFFTTRDVGKGLGLGLSISYSVIQRHGGTLAVTSQEGEWARFTFDLPRAE
ncbi:sensor histidine kinase [Ralstonia soli]|uniref:histidine kinase n=1 Tax=Ralstonia soli TaxID=2953896 RepID=A0ABT1ANV8_9RALS|nr:ATP-binding protein [Ralstonia soli]MCO5400080.1 ATP-binding protein [Ralstonia soli]